MQAFGFTRTGRSNAIVLCLLGILGHNFAAAQQISKSLAAPQIIVSGSAEVQVPATKASFSIGIMTSASTAAAAGEDNSRISKTVLLALENAGLKHEEIKASRFGVLLRWEYGDSGRRPKRSAFEATNTIQVETENLAQVGNFIDAALSAGATDASEITFSAKDIDEARRRALGQAVVAARTDAEAMARAAGGALGDLVLLSTERVGEAPGVDQEEIVVTAARRAPPPIPTNVIPGPIQVTARVIARWKFLSNQTAK